MKAERSEVFMAQAERSDAGPSGSRRLTEVTA